MILIFCMKTILHLFHVIQISNQIDSFHVASLFISMNLFYMFFTGNAEFCFVNETHFTRIRGEYCKCDVSSSGIPVSVSFGHPSREEKKEKRKKTKMYLHIQHIHDIASSAWRDVRIRMHQCLSCQPSSVASLPLGVQELRSVRCTVKGSVNNFVHCRDYNMDGWQDNYWRPFESNCFLH